MKAEKLHREEMDNKNKNLSSLRKAPSVEMAAPSGM
jgi:hypothetical protein